MADVFVSYSHRDLERAEQLAAGIEESGWSLWWDDRLSASDDYAQVIERELGAAGAVVVAWSASARDSLWVRAEANEALDAGTIVQLTLDGAKLPLPFTALHFLDFSRWRGERGVSPWTELDGRIGGLLRGERIAVEVRAREPALQGLGLPVVLGWAAIALASLMAAAAGAAAARAIPAQWFATAAAAGFALAMLLLVPIAFLTLRVFRASRR